MAMNIKSLLNHIARITNAKTYLEIGLKSGSAFFDVSIDSKIGIGQEIENNIFNAADIRSQTIKISSGEFFTNLSQLKATVGSIPETWDVIFIDDLRTFESTYDTFANSVAYSTDQTIWIINSTVPGDSYSAYPDRAHSIFVRRSSGLAGNVWAGDVYKAIFAIHDNFPDISYCTLMDLRTPATILWKSQRQERAAVFKSLTEIACLTYCDIFKNAELLVPVEYINFPYCLYKSFCPADYKDKNLVKKLIYAPPATINEREFERYLKLFHKDASEKISVLQEQMRELNDKYHKVLEEKDKEINFFKNKTIRLQAMLEKMSDRSAV